MDNIVASQSVTFLYKNILIDFNFACPLQAGPVACYALHSLLMKKRILCLVLKS